MHFSVMLTMNKYFGLFFEVTSIPFFKLEKKNKANFILIEMLSHCLKKKYVFWNPKNNYEEVINYTKIKEIECQCKYFSYTNFQDKKSKKWACNYLFFGIFLKFRFSLNVSYQN